MFKKECSVTGKANVEKVWGLYEDVSRWSEWDKSLSNVVLEGAFENGNVGTMFFSMQDIPPLKFELKEVNKNKRFLSIATLGDVKVMTDHFIACDSDEEVTIKHVVTVEGNNEGMVQGIGNGLTGKLEEYMKNILLLS